VQADIDTKLAADLEHCRAHGLRESLAHEIAVQRRREHEEYEARISRYVALGHTRAYARRFMLMAERDPQRAHWLYRLRWGRELP
jgi:hypothetical protein